MHASQSHDAEYNRNAESERRWALVGIAMFLAFAVIAAVVLAVELGAVE